MEVAGQWRREWAGAAEYGKVTEGGVTRRVARALEVLHTSGPGARVRVMRAAYHSSAGPGAPASSYMLHSSRRVISSGSNILESSSFSNKPLEISSTPLESLPESNLMPENYKVTEPDDLEISEPSKWIASTSRNSIRMPSEESSSTDNASIIDLDSRINHKNVFRKHSFDSENSDSQSISRNSTRASPLLDAPVMLSTLKYKSLLNGGNEWNNRRKSYSFEDTSPLNEVIMHTNDTLAMESSTDSGICKSSEVVNDHIDDNLVSKHIEQNNDKNEKSFKDWLYKNRPSTFYKGNQSKPYREHEIVLEDPIENNITLQSTGKVSITLPITIETEDDNQCKKTHVSDDSDRKIKKVEFCKTELHFAAESGKVNIIATDDKPPPSNDFRKRRSAFVPMKNNFEKPITLFGEKINDFSEVTDIRDYSNFNSSEIGETDENTAATKSILKNKIPKPKPYLLGENMVFGQSDNLMVGECYRNDSFVPIAVSLINQQLQTERRHSYEATKFSSDTDTTVMNNGFLRTINNSPFGSDDSKQVTNSFQVKKHENPQIVYEATTNKGNATNSVKQKLKILQISPTEGRAKTRQLRESDLTYFGIDNCQKTTKCKFVEEKPIKSHENDPIDNLFHSVKLIQQISNSVCNSEAESEETSEYQNIPIRNNFAPIPTPRSRFKTNDTLKENEAVTILKPIIEQDSEVQVAQGLRRSRLRKHEETIKSMSRSISEPPKITKSSESSRQPCNRFLINGSPSQRLKTNCIREDETIKEKIHKTPKIQNKKRIEDETSIYINFNTGEERRRKEKKYNVNLKQNVSQQKKSQNKIDSNESDRNTNSIKSHSKNNSNNRLKENVIHKGEIEHNKDSLHKKQLFNKKKLQPTEKSTTPECSINNQRKTSDEVSIARKSNTSSDNKYTSTDQSLSHRTKKKHQSLSSQQHPAQSRSEKILKGGKDTNTKRLNVNKDTENSDVKDRDRNSSKDRSYNSKTNQKPDVNADRHRSLTRSKNNGTEKTNNVKTDNRKMSRRSEYVINYDDKNGTVSSICKVKSGPGTLRRKKIGDEKVKDGPAGQKIKTSDKMYLLQLPERQRIQNGLSNTNRKLKTKVHVQRSCQLL